MAEVPEGWRFIDCKRIDEFTKISYIQSDGYVVYRHLAKHNLDLLKLLQCWAHVQSKYKDAEICGDPFASWFVDRIGQLYLIEAECLLKGLSA